MIKKLRVKNFKALRNIEIELTPIHVLIGPNNSGKTSILEVLAALCRSVDHKLNEAFLGSWKGAELVWTVNPQLPINLVADFDDPKIKTYSISLLCGWLNGYKEINLLSESVDDGTLKENLDAQRKGNITAVYSDFYILGEIADKCKQIKELLQGIHFYRFDPSFLALPVAPDSKRSFRIMD